MAWVTEAKKILRIASAGLSGIETIGELIAPLLKNTKIDEEVRAVLTNVHALVNSLKNSAEGKVSIDEAEDDIALIKSTIRSNDQRTPSLIDSKFGPKD